MSASDTQGLFIDTDLFVFFFCSDPQTQLSVCREEKKGQGLVWPCVCGWWKTPATVARCSRPLQSIDRAWGGGSVAVADAINIFILYKATYLMQYIYLDAVLIAGQWRYIAVGAFGIFCATFTVCVHYTTPHSINSTRGVRAWRVCGTQPPTYSPLKIHLFLFDPLDYSCPWMYAKHPIYFYLVPPPGLLPSDVMQHASRSLRGYCPHVNPGRKKGGKEKEKTREYLNVSALLGITVTGIDPPPFLLFLDWCRTGAGQSTHSQTRDSVSSWSSKLQYTSDWMWIVVKCT